MKLPAFAFDVPAVKIRELVDAIGDDNPVYRSSEAAMAEGYRDTPCPPTFITLACQEFTGYFLRVLNELGIPLVKALHGE
ncbi:MAG: MaoC family dehydratase N-terminal domain-containing protein, partial [Deltaproteobacteria bacterium]|nr:MaoC family dehydratase N-terminal domain-containing protein [Deltaproteobacteria bacterium]